MKNKLCSLDTDFRHLVLPSAWMVHRCKVRKVASVDRAYPARLPVIFLTLLLATLSSIVGSLLAQLEVFA